MATLADLFVSYKSVQPEGKEREITAPTRPTGLPGIETIKHRLQRIAEKNATNAVDESQVGDAGQQVVEVDDFDTENIDDFDTEDIDDVIFQEYVKQQYQPQVTESRDGVPSGTDTKSQGFVPSGTVTRYNRGTLDKEIQELFRRNGIKIKVTSGKRAAGAAGKAGKKSHHVQGNAVDIVPGDGETFASIRKKMQGNPEIRQFFYANGLGVIDETDPATMRRTGATGKHFHIGPDRWAIQTWTSWTRQAPLPSAPATREEWTRNVQSAFEKGLKREYGNKYDAATYKRISTYMTYQAALESGYGKYANGYNYSGHKRNGKTVRYDTMDDFVRAHIKALQKWDFMKAKSLKDYVDSLYQGQYRYNASDSPATYYSAINGTTARINKYLGLSARFGGKFTVLRQLSSKGLDG